MALTQVSSGMLGNTGVTAGTYGGSSAIPVLTVNAEGQVTSASNVSVSSTAVYANSGQLTANAATGTVALGLATTAVAAGSYGGATLSNITVDSYGRITAASNVANASLCCVCATGCITSTCVAGTYVNGTTCVLSPYVCGTTCVVTPCLYTNGICQCGAGNINSNCCILGQVLCGIGCVQGTCVCAAGGNLASNCCVVAPIHCATTCFVGNGSGLTNLPASYKTPCFTILGGVNNGALCCYTIPSNMSSAKIYAVGQGGCNQCGGGGGGFAAGCLSLTPGCIICVCFCCGCAIVIYNSNTLMVACCSPGTTGGTACICSSLFTSCAVSYTGGCGGSGLGGGGGSAGSPLGNGYNGGACSPGSYTGAGGAGIGGAGSYASYNSSGGGAGGTGCLAGGGAGGPASGSQPGPARSILCMFTDPLLQYAWSPGGQANFCGMSGGNYPPGPGGGGAGVSNQAGNTQVGQPGGDFGGGGGSGAWTAGVLGNGGNGGFLGGGGGISCAPCNTGGYQGGNGGCGGGGGGGGCCTGCFYTPGSGGYPVFLIYG